MRAEGRSAPHFVLVVAVRVAAQLRALADRLSPGALGAPLISQLAQALLFQPLQLLRDRGIIRRRYGAIAIGRIAVDITGTGAPVAIFRGAAEFIIEPAEAVAGYAADDSSIGRHRPSLRAKSGRALNAG